MNKGASSGDDRATAAEPVVSALRDSVPSAEHIELGSLYNSLSWPKPTTRCDLIPLWAGEFSSHSDWVSFAATRLTGAHNGRSEVRAICVDSLGRRCHDGGDFARARDEGTFPVRYFWECIPAKAIEAHRAETQGGSVHESAGRQASPKGGSHD